MSFTELHKGKLRKVSSNPDKFAEWYFKANHIELDESYDTPLEQLLDDNKYIILKGSIYSIDDTNFGESYYNWCNKDYYGEIKYIVQFHNGECSLNEALEEALKGII